MELAVVAIVACGAVVVLLLIVGIIVLRHTATAQRPADTAASAPSPAASDGLAPPRSQAAEAFQSLGGSIYIKMTNLHLPGRLRATSESPPSLPTSYEGRSPLSPSSRGSLFSSKLGQRTSLIEESRMSAMASLREKSAPQQRLGGWSDALQAVVCIGVALPPERAHPSWEIRVSSEAHGELRVGMMGTGFFLDDHGIIFTCDSVLQVPSL